MAFFSAFGGIVVYFCALMCTHLAAFRTAANIRKQGIAHRMRTVESADKIVDLSQGKIVEEGSPTELYQKNDSIFRRMHDLQSASADWSV